MSPTSPEAQARLTHFFEGNNKIEKVNLTHPNVLLSSRLQKQWASILLKSTQEPPSPLTALTHLEYSEKSRKNGRRKLKRNKKENGKNGKNKEKGQGKRKILKLKKTFFYQGDYETRDPAEWTSLTAIAAALDSLPWVSRIIITPHLGRSDTEYKADMWFEVAGYMIRRLGGVELIGVQAKTKNGPNSFINRYPELIKNIPVILLYSRKFPVKGWIQNIRAQASIWLVAIAQYHNLPTFDGFSLQETAKSLGLDPNLVTPKRKNGRGVMHPDYISSVLRAFELENEGPTIY